MTRVWFDPQGAAMVIERFGVFPAGALRMTAADGWLRLAPPGLKDAFASPWALLADESGAGFVSEAAATAYLAGELARRAAATSPLRIDVAAAATWILAHGLGRVPLVQAFLPGGELIATDVTADATHVTLVFPSPIAGFVLLS